MLSGERIKNIRKMRGITQKELGMSVGFEETTADIRVAQYESNNRTPKANLLNAMAEKLDVSPYALGEPQIETKLSLLHTLFAIEDLYGLEVNGEDGELSFRILTKDPKLQKAFRLWAEKQRALSEEELGEEEYNLFRYSYKDVEDKALKERAEKPRTQKKPLKKEAKESKDEYWLL